MAKPATPVGANSFAIRAGPTPNSIAAEAAPTRHGEASNPPRSEFIRDRWQDRHPNPIAAEAAPTRHGEASNPRRSEFIGYPGRADTNPSRLKPLLPGMAKPATPVGANSFAIRAGPTPNSIAAKAAPTRHNEASYPRRREFIRDRWQDRHPNSIAAKAAPTRHNEASYPCRREFIRYRWQGRHQPIAAEAAPTRGIMKPATRVGANSFAIAGRADTQPHRG